MLDQEEFNRLHANFLEVCQDNIELMTAISKIWYYVEHLPTCAKSLGPTAMEVAECTCGLRKLVIDIQSRFEKKEND